MIRFTKAKHKLIKPPQSIKKQSTLQKLNAYLNQTEPEAVEFLYRDLTGMQNAVTYKELREAYMAGSLTDAQFETWQTQYAQMVNNDLKPKWEAAANEAAEQMKAQYPYFLYNPQASASMDWISQHGAELVTNLAQEQKDAINTMIQHVSGYTAMTPDKAAMIIRPTIGLTVPQAMANARYREAVKEAYLQAHPKAKPETAEKKAKDAAAKYGAKQHRYRAQSIARTELAFGYNAGAYGATKDAQAQGYIGDCKKKWLTAFDERVCPYCAVMDEETRNMDELFSNGKMLPPGHPMCRCAVAYEEIEGTHLTPNTAQSTINTGTPQQSAPTPANPAIGTTAPDAGQIGQLTGIDPNGMPIKTESGYQVSEMLNDMSILPDTPNGVAIRSDGTMVEQMNMTGRKIAYEDGKEWHEISGKLTEGSWKAAQKHTAQHGHPGKIQFEMMNPATGKYKRGDITLELDGLKIKGPDWSGFEVYAGDEQYGMAGFFRARVPVSGDPRKDGETMAQLLDKAGLRNLASNPTAQDELRMKKIRLAWQRDPKAYEKARHLTGAKQDEAIDKILAKQKITAERAAGLKAVEVFPGYTTLVDPAALQEYKKAGLTHVWAGVTDADSVVAICKSDGFSATNRRILTGMKKCGASPGRDMETGGSSGVFTRIGVSTDKRYSNSFLGDDYRVILHPDVMTRTDWWAHVSDEFGEARSDSPVFQKRLSPVGFIKEMKKGYTSGNEIIFREGISKDSFIGISCETEQHKTDLLNAFRNAGVTEMNGVPIEDFVKVTNRIGEDSQRGIHGLDFYDTDAPFF